MNINKIIVMFMFLLLSMTVVSAVSYEDKILNARSTTPIWTSSTSYLAGDILLYEGVAYKILQPHTSQFDWLPSSTPALYVEYSFQDYGEIPNFKQPTGAHDAYQIDYLVRFNGYVYKSLINANVWSPTGYPAGWQEVGFDTSNDVTSGTSITFDDVGFYSEYAGIFHENLTGTETSRIDRNLVSLDNYNTNLNEFEVVMYTGNDGIPYDILWHPDATANFTTVLEQGSILKKVVSKDGFITYTTDSFSTQIASIPTMVLGTYDTATYNIANYFIDYNTVEISLWEVPDSWNAESNCNLNICTITEGVTYSFNEDPLSDADVTYDETFGDLFTVESYNSYVTFEVSVVVSTSGSGYAGDSFDVLIVDSVSQIATIAPVSLTGTESVTRNFDSYFEFYETIEVSFQDSPSLPDIELTQFIGQAGDDNYEGTLSVSLDAKADHIEIDITGLDSDYGPKTFTVTAIGYDSSTTSTTFTVEVDGSITPPETPDPTSSTILNESTILYFSFDDDDLSGSNPLDLTDNNNDGVNDGATTGVTGKLNEAFSFTTDDNVTAPVSYGNAFSLSGWFKYNDGRTVLSGKDTDTNMVYMTGNTARCEVRTDTGNYVKLGTTNINDGSLHHIICTYSTDTDSLKLYIDGNYEGATTATATTINTETFIRVGYGNGAYATTTVDELALFNKELNTTEVAFLYNSDSPTGEQQFPFVSVAPPVQLLSIANINLVVDSDATRNLPTYWDSYDNIYISYTDPVNSSVINLTTSESSSNTHFDITLNAFDSMLIESKKSLSALPITMLACNSGGCNSTSFNLTITNPLLQLASIANMTLGGNSEGTRIYSTYFSGYSNVSASWNDGTQHNITVGETVSNENYTISITSLLGDTRLIVTSKNTEFDFLINMSVSIGNEYLWQTFNLSVNLAFELVKPFPDVTLVDATNLVNVATYITNYDSYYILVSGTGLDSTLNLSNGESETTPYYHTIAVSGNQITFEPLYYAFSGLSVTVVATNGTDTVTDTFTVRYLLGEPAPTPGEVDLDDTFDTIFGSASTKTKALGSLVLIGALFISLFTATGTIAGGLFGAFLGIIAGVVFGLISLLTLLLIIILPVIGLIFYLLFGNRN